jgi:hypothetical protein
MKWTLTAYNPKADAKDERFVIEKETGILTGITIETLVNGWGVYQDRTRASVECMVLAAPEMLDALHRATAWVDKYKDAPGHDAAARLMGDHLRRVIAKATPNKELST